MKCPRCGSDAASENKCCVVCGRDVRAAPVVRYAGLPEGAVLMCPESGAKNMCIEGNCENLSLEVQESTENDGDSI